VVVSEGRDDIVVLARRSMLDLGDVAVFVDVTANLEHRARGQILDHGKSPDGVVGKRHGSGMSS
jgi:hypothetical protein